MNVGDLMYEKMSNMEQWLVGEGLKVNVTVKTMHKAQLVALAQHIPKDAVATRSFARLFEQEEPEVMLALVKFVEARPELHDKFWRYLELFSEYCNSDE